MKERIVFLEYRSFERTRVLFFSSDIEMLYEILDGRSTFLDTRLQIPMHSQDVLGNRSITLFIRVIGDDEQQIETR